MGRFSVHPSSGSSLPDPLSTLPSHPMFTHNIRTPSTPQPGQGMKQRAMVSINGLLIAVVGSELRMMHLTANGRRGKGKGRESDDEAEGDQLMYKILHPPSSTSHTFLPSQQITQLVPNHLGTVLAVVSIKEVIVFEVPRWEDWEGEELVAVDPLPIGQPGSSAASRSTPNIVKVDWHPWGSNGSSLLILTEDAVLREYDISTSCARPAQTISLLPTHRPTPARSHLGSSSSPSSSSSPYIKKSTNAYGISDELNQPAVSFAIGKGDAGWAPLTVYGLMEDGDVWAVCPFMPSRCSIPTDYVEALAVYLDVERDRLEAMSSEASRDPKSRFLSQQSVQERIIWQKGNQLQTRYVSLLRNQVARSLHGEDPTTNGSPLRARSRRSLPPGKQHQTHVEVRPPSERDMRNLRVVRQGPFRTDPESVDLGDIASAPKGVEGIASDIFVLPRGTRVDPVAKGKGKSGMGQTGDKEEEDDAPGAQLGVIGIVWAEGKVDMCIETEPVEALWTAAEIDKLDEASAILVYESIDLGLLDLARPLPKPTSSPIAATRRQGFFAATSDTDSDEEDEIENPSILLQHPPVVFADYFDQDNVYIQHAFGLHALSTSEWRTALFEASTAGDREESLAAFWESEIQTEVSCLVAVERYPDSDPSPLTGTTILAAIPLPPSIIFTTQKLACGSLPLKLRSVKPEAEQPRAVSKTVTKPGYHSILNDSELDVEDVDFEEILNDIAARDQYPPAALRQNITTVSGKQLTDLGKATDEYRRGIKSIKDLARTVDARLELQRTESRRQLEALQSLMTRINRMKDGEQEEQGLQNLSDRWSQVAAAQADMSSRVDAVYQKLIDHSQPMISDQEERWFSELDRMDAQVNGNKTLDIPSQASKLERLATEYEGLKPTLSSIQRDEERLSSVSVKSPAKSPRREEAAPLDLQAVNRSVAQEKEKLNTLLNGLNDLKDKLKETA